MDKAFPISHFRNKAGILLCVDLSNFDKESVRDWIDHLKDLNDESINCCNVRIVGTKSNLKHEKTVSQDLLLIAEENNLVLTETDESYENVADIITELTVQAVKTSPSFFEKTTFKIR